MELQGFHVQTLHRFIEAVLTLKEEVVVMPNREQRAENIQKVFTKYKLLNVVSGIDGCHMPFEERPRFVNKLFGCTFLTKIFFLIINKTCKYICIFVLNCYQKNVKQMFEFLTESEG